MPRGDADELIDKIIDTPRRYRACTLGRLLGLTQQEHELGNIRSIRPLGVTDADMKIKELTESEKGRKTSAVAREWCLERSGLLPTRRAAMSLGNRSTSASRLIIAGSSLAKFRVRQVRPLH